MRGLLKVVRELVFNLNSSIITYQLPSTRTQQSAVIKRFIVALEAANSSGFKAYEREISYGRCLANR